MELCAAPVALRARLPFERCEPPALIDRPAQLQRDAAGSTGRVEIGVAQILARPEPTGQVERRAFGRRRRADVELGGRNVALRLEDVGMTPQGDSLGRGHVIAKTREVIRRTKIARRAAHGLAEFLDGAREITLGHGEPAARERDRRFGLGDIGPGDLAHLEPVLRRAQLFLSRLRLLRRNETNSRLRITFI